VFEQTKDWPETGNPQQPRGNPYWLFDVYQLDRQTKTFDDVANSDGKIALDKDHPDAAPDRVALSTDCLVGTLYISHKEFCSMKGVKKRKFRVTTDIWCRPP